MSYGWEGTKVRLVPLDKSRHLENALRWINDPETTSWTLIGDLPLTRLAEEAYFDRASSPPEDEVAFAIETLDGEHVGFTGIFKINRTHGTAETGVLIGPVEKRGQGLGSDTIRIRTRYAFEVLGLRLLLTHAMSENQASRRALQKAGYEQIGTIPRCYWKRGAYRDVVLFMLERDAWMAGPAAYRRE